MYLLHGHQGRYLHGLATGDGVRDSTAGFAYPYHFDERRFICSVICSIYHSIGIDVLRKAVSEECTLQDQLQVVGGIYLSLFHESVVDEDVVGADRYVMDGIESYAYRKLANGPLQYLGSVKIDDGHFDGVVRNGSDGLRFFQKVKGRAHYVKNCDMNLLLKMCSAAAEDVSPKIMTLMKGDCDGIDGVG